MNGMSFTDSYFALMNASADGIQQSLTASFYTLQAEIIWSVIVLAAITVVLRALTSRSHADLAERGESRYERDLREALWELLLRDAQRLTFYRFSDRHQHMHHKDKGNAA